LLSSPFNGELPTIVTVAKSTTAAADISIRFTNVDSLLCQQKLNLSAGLEQVDHSENETPDE
jgi:hypothetical protein